MNTTRITASVLAVLTFAFVGCGGGSGSATVSGEVKVDGVPLAKGTISFVSADGKGQPATAEIKDGHYEIKTTAGKKTVQISAPVVVDKRKESNAPNAPIVEITAESLPEKYHAKSELTFDVQSGGPARTGRSRARSDSLIDWIATEPSSHAPKRPPQEGAVSSLVPTHIVL